MVTRIACVALLAVGCRSITGVELFIEHGSQSLAELDVTARYPDHAVEKSVDNLQGDPIDFIARLNDEPTTVTFGVVARFADGSTASASSDPIAVTPHHLSRATLTLAGDGDGFVAPSDLGGDAAGSGWAASNVPSGGGTITGIWGSSGSDVYATVARNGSFNLLHSIDHGGSWTPQLVGGSGVDLNAIAGTSARDLYVVGDGAFIAHYDGMAWTTQTPPVQATTRLLGVLALPSGDAWAVGGGNTILWHQPQTSFWYAQSMAGATELRGIWGVTGNLWAVGANGTILTSNGKGIWSPVASNTTAELRAIFGTSDGGISDGGISDGGIGDGGAPSSDVWAVATASCSTSTARGNRRAAASRRACRCAQSAVAPPVR